MAAAVVVVVAVVAGATRCSYKRGETDGLKRKRAGMGDDAADGNEKRDAYLRAAWSGASERCRPARTTD